ncbi:hypothetical protein N7474_010490 [Penicillium riverlandense]|uniref:uncharacterized protein n=1 Tax=Penicillium riverlandense TaxID=1903569 RepID=UPI0025486059|nr:uncharacterized protein N7474_010490 [Penicillium riverlandense]KAJ5806898.1 hypothetical protein N7474_010490 [Penicillium riverlandense]
MVLRWIVNVGLLAIPIGGTIGAILGIEAHRQANGQAPLFAGGGNDGSGGGSTGSPGNAGHHFTDNGVTYSQYCRKSYGIPPESTGQHFTFNPNQWGVTSSTVGGLCMNITTFDNQTYATKYTAPEFSASWYYAQGDADQPTHAYPNVMVDDILPVELQKMSALNLDFEWAYGVGNTTAASTDVATLTTAGLNGNVAIDMFFDADSTTAQDSQKAKYEVMIWFAAFGPGTQPVGPGNVVTTHVLDGTKFELFSGVNGIGQTVLTWNATQVTDTFNGDISPLITDLYNLGAEGYPEKTDYLGVFQLGTEAFYSNGWVTFSVPTLSVDIQV